MKWRVTGLPDNLPIQQKAGLFFKIKLKGVALQKQPIFLLNAGVIWQNSDSRFYKELHALCHS